MFPRNFKRLIYFLIWGFLSFICGLYFSTMLGIGDVLPNRQLDSEIVKQYNIDHYIKRLPPHLKQRASIFLLFPASAPRHLVLKFYEGPNDIPNPSNLLCSNFCVCNILLKQVQNSCILLDSVFSKDSNFLANSPVKQPSFFDLSLPVRIRFNPKFTGPVSDLSYDLSEFPFPSKWPFAGRGFHPLPQPLRTKVDFTLEARPFVVQTLRL